MKIRVDLVAGVRILRGGILNDLKRGAEEPRGILFFLAENDLLYFIDIISDPFVIYLTDVIIDLEPFILDFLKLKVMEKFLEKVFILAFLVCEFKCEWFELAICID